MKSQPITVYLPDTKGVRISPYGSGNLKLGFGVYTYSREPGGVQGINKPYGAISGTCPGATKECEAICFAKAVDGLVRQQWYTNSQLPLVPPIPKDARYLRLHVGGDFDSVIYIDQWITRLTERPDVLAWAYTRSWRVPGLLPALERLRALPNMQLFASMDASSPDLPPTGWRRSWIMRGKATEWPMEDRLTYTRTMIERTEPGDTHTSYEPGVLRTSVTADGCPSYICPEETGEKPNCLDCGYCFRGQKHDVTFIEHGEHLER